MIYYDVYLMHSKIPITEQNNEHADIYINSISLKIRKKLFSELSLNFALTKFFLQMINNQSSRTTQKSVCSNNKVNIKILRLD